MALAALAGTGGLATGAGAAAGDTNQGDRAPVLLVLGDSLSAEYGLRRGEGWVALLELRLAEQKIPARIVNASISGETTSGGRSRIAALLREHHPQTVVVELGANDALRGLPVAQTEANLQAIVEAAQKAEARVLIVGIQVPPNYGMTYLKRFEQVFSDVGDATRSPVVPFLLKNVADGPDATSMFQADRIHPVAAAHPRILENVWPALRKLLVN
ncbi:MAG: arylesterase [Variovorax sp.]